MTRHTGSSKVDNRKSSIEVQFGAPIELSKTKILGVVMPETLLQSKIFLALLESFNVTATPYILTGGCSTEHDGVLIAESTKLLRKFL